MFEAIRSAWKRSFFYRLFMGSNRDTKTMKEEAENLPEPPDVTTTKAEIDATKRRLDRASRRMARLIDVEIEAVSRDR